MQCTRPIKLVGLELPCGKCIGCKIPKSRDWTARIIQELDYFPDSCFMSLTYNEAKIPENGSLKKKDLQNFVKRLRKSTQKKIKYFGCGDYGEDNNRPHYHMIMLGIAQNWEGFVWIMRVKGKKGYIDLYEVEEWKNGYVHVGTATQDSVRYVTDYIMKKYDGTLAVEKYGQKERPFRIVSQGFGKRFCLKFAEDLKKREYMTLRGVQLGLPRYYRDILEIKNPIYIDRLKDRAFWVKLDTAVTLLEKTGSLMNKDHEEINKQIRGQYEKNYKGRAETRSKKTL